MKNFGISSKLDKQVFRLIEVEKQIKELEAQKKLLQDEIKDYMEAHDIHALYGDKTWVNYKYGEDKPYFSQTMLKNADIDTYNKYMELRPYTYFKPDLITK